jgi:hypothetical protein
LAVRRQLVNGTAPCDTNTQCTNHETKKAEMGSYFSLGTFLIKNDEN